MLVVMFLCLCLYVLIDAIYTFFVAFCPCILNIAMFLRIPLEQVTVVMSTYVVEALV